MQQPWWSKLERVSLDQCKTVPITFKYYSELLKPDAYKARPLIHFKSEEQTKLCVLTRRYLYYIITEWCVSLSMDALSIMLNFSKLGDDVDNLCKLLLSETEVRTTEEVPMSDPDSHLLAYPTHLFEIEEKSPQKNLTIRFYNIFHCMLCWFIKPTTDCSQVYMYRPDYLSSSTAIPERSINERMIIVMNGERDPHNNILDRQPEDLPVRITMFVEKGAFGVGLIFKILKMIQKQLSVDIVLMDEPDDVHALLRIQPTESKILDLIKSL